MKPLESLDDPDSREGHLSLQAEVRHDHLEAPDGTGEYIIDLFFKIYSEWSTSGDFEIEAGEVHLRLVRLEAAIEEDVSLASLFDFDSSMSSLSELYKWNSPYWDFVPAVLELCPEANSYADLFSVERLALRPWARRQRAGLRIIQMLLRNWRSGCSLAVIDPSPLQTEFETPAPGDSDIYDLKSLPKDVEDSTRKLTHYYQKLDFKRVPGSRYLIRSLEEKGPRIDDLDLPDHLLIPSSIAGEIEGNVSSGQ